MWICKLSICSFDSKTMQELRSVGTTGQKTRGSKILLQVFQSKKKWKTCFKK